MIIWSPNKQTFLWLCRDGDESCVLIFSSILTLEEKHWYLFLGAVSTGVGHIGRWHQGPSLEESRNISRSKYVTSESLKVESGALMTGIISCCWSMIWPIWWPFFCWPTWWHTWSTLDLLLSYSLGTVWHDLVSKLVLKIPMLVANFRNRVSPTFFYWRDQSSGLMVPSKPGREWANYPFSLVCSDSALLFRTRFYFIF